MTFDLRSGEAALRGPKDLEWLPEAEGYGAAAAKLRELVDLLTFEGDTEVSQPEDAPRWLDDIYSLVAKGKADDAVDVLFREIDDLLGAGKFNRCNQVLETIDLHRLDLNLIVAVLSITLPAIEKLPYRKQLLGRARRRVHVLAPDRSERLLKGL